MWSLGVMLYECCNLDPPFLADNMLQLAKLIEQVGADTHAVLTYHVSMIPTPSLAY